MSVTLATMADALIEFILSLLRDPEAQAQFEKDPESALAHHGLQAATAADVCAVAPVIIERPQIVTAPAAAPATVYTHSDPVVREIRQITNNFSYTDHRSTVVDQSVNQAIWAQGDVTQHFDNHTVVASGDGSMAAGAGIDIDQTRDQSTTIVAGHDANVGNDTHVDTTTTTNDTTNDTVTVTDDSVDSTLVDSGNESSSDVAVDDSFHDTSSVQSYDEVSVDDNSVHDSTDSTIIDDSTDDHI